MPLVFPSAIGPLDLDTLVEGYIREIHSLRTADPDAVWDGENPDTAAYEALEIAILRGAAADAWIAVLELLRRVPDEELENYAAGPLENLVSKRGAELIGQIEAEAERDERFKWALGCVWLSRGQLPDDILERVVFASGGQIHPLPPLDELKRLWPGPGDDGSA